MESTRELIQMARAAERDERLSDGALYGKLASEIERLQCMVLTLTEAAVIADSYGVQGSDFHTCLVCGAGGAPGIPFRHDDQCAVGRAEETANGWAREQREEMEDYEAEEKKLRTENSRLRAVIEDAIDTLEAMDMYAGNPLYNRLVLAMDVNQQSTSNS